MGRKDEEGRESSNSRTWCRPQGAGLSEVLRLSYQSDTGKEKANGRGKESLQGTETQHTLA